MHHTSTRSRRTTAIFAAAAAVLTLAAGCASASSTDSTGGPAESGSDVSWDDTGEKIEVMGWSAGDEVATSRLEFAQKATPDVTIVPDENGFDQQKFATAMGSGSAPAGVSLDRQLIATYAAKGFLEPLDGCIDQHSIDMDQFYPDAVQESSWDGHIYGIPEFFTTRAVYVNLDALDEAGLTVDDIDTSDWESLTKLAGTLYRDDGGRPSRIGFDPKVPEFLPLWVLAAGGNLVDRNGSPTLDDDAVVEALTWAVDMINAQGGWSDFKSFRDSWDFFGADNEFVQDQVAVMPYEQWYVNVLAGTDAHFTVIPFQDRNGEPLTFETGSSLAIPTGSPNAGGMCEFIKNITSTDAWRAAGAARHDKVAEDGSAFTGIFSANKTANDAIRDKYVSPTGNDDLDQAINTFYDSLDNAQMIPPSPAGQQIQEAYQKAVTAAVGGKDPQQALDQAQQTALRAYQDATS